MTDIELYVSNIQALFRGYFYRKINLPNSIRYLKKEFVKLDITLTKESEDGRINSAIDEETIIDNMIKIMGGRIKKGPTRHWWDCKIFDYKYKWLPINVKCTTTITSDNTGNMIMLAYALTNANIMLDKSYKNGSSSKLFLDKIKSKEFNLLNKRDYYFFTVNKTNTNDIICNSIKGLNNITGNNNNLPFQVCWNKNRYYMPRKSIEVLDYITKIITSKKKTWKEEFLEEMRSLKI